MDESKRLRALLDERGIEYVIRVPWNDTAWEHDGTHFTATERFGKIYLQTSQGPMTPEQAIAATVGNGTDLSKRLREVHGLHAFAELFGFDWHDESDWSWHDVACAMADAIDATVGVGTCKLVDNDSGPDMHCTACGGEVDDEYRYFMDIWGYSRCPHCGARIIEVVTE